MTVRSLVVASVVLAALGAARADTIALVSDDAALHAALVDAGDTVTVTTEAAPGVSELAASSRAVADRLGATVTVWLIPGGTTTSLVTYDRGADRVIVRELPYAPPLDAARATEAARIVRTMLRSIRTPDDVVVAPAKPAIAPPAVVVPEPREPQLAIGAGGGVWIAAPGTIANPVVTIRAAWRPNELGAQLDATLAPAPDLEMPTFRGDVRDIVLGAVVRNALAFGPGIRLVPSGGVAVHLIHVDGTTVDSRRFDPALRVGLAVLRGLPRGLETGLDVSADCLLRRQRYAAGTEEILLVPRVQIIAAVVIGVRL